MGHYSSTSNLCTSDQLCDIISNTFCNNGTCACHAGYKYVSALQQCIPSPQFGLKCSQHSSCRTWDRNMVCDTEVRRCICSMRHAYDQSSQMCRPAVGGLCPSGLKWNTRIANCEGRGSRYRGGDKMVDVIIVLVFFVILLLVIRKWKPGYQGLDRDLSWPVRGFARDNAAAVLFLSPANRPPGRPSNANGDLGPMVFPPPPQYNVLADSNSIFEPQEPPPSYEEAMAMAAHQGQKPASATVVTIDSVNRASNQESSGNNQRLCIRRDSDDPFQV
ncbi:hypothetical protein HDE_07982 [Halotydeus destructor]|nr:hypothetical protein HDE_07982 [Halotydeus destructor]